ncbi:ABC transporter ATP-binding protein [uncultured Desulfobacter sp.]|uniref:ABC transporter ATP-binding protein n=1 Tax=uncultured Desulfobacter sp. TaxID=240139 RepID=UPI002AA5F71F|nr:ABC transporter ATP-binding protein [uncultured Desulfobacter sp.]
MFINTLKKVAGGKADYMNAPVAAAVLEGLFVAAPYVILALILPNILEGKMAENRFWFWYAALLLCFGLRALFALKSYGGGMRAGYRMGAAIRLNLGEHLRKLSMGFFSRRDTGELVNRLFLNTEMVEQMVSHFLTQSVTNLCTAGFIMAALFFINPLMAAVMVSALVMGLPLLVGLLKFVGREIEKKGKITDRANSRILEYLHGIMVFKAYNVTGMGFERLKRALDDLRRFAIQFEVKGFTVALTYVAILELGFVGLAFTGVLLVRAGRLGIAEMIVFLVVSLRFYRPLHRFSENAALTRATFTGARAIEEIFDHKPMAGDETAALEDFDICFESVGFGYDADAGRVVTDVDFTAPARSMTALVGPSGSGKSTLIKLAARFWDIDQGRITVGGKDVRTMAPEALLSNISMVFQDVYLFKDTILNNIRIGNDKAGRNEVEVAARKAQCHELIMNLPEGYDTMVGEGGATLSGGEKQRIAIARAMLKDAPIILLDEATAALDPENDRLVQAAIDRLIQSKTLLVIAHRLHTVSAADQIVVLDHGRVVQKGQHRELVAQNGLYARLWQEQQQPVGFGSSLPKSGSNHQGENNR